MANQIMQKYKEALLSGAANVDLTTGSVKVMMIDTGTYTFSAAHQFRSDITAGVIATSAALTSKSVTNGTFAASAATCTAVSGATVEALYLFIDTGVTTTSRLVAWWDTATGLTFTPNGGDVTITPSGGNWFTL